MSQKYEKLKSLLKELFQLDQPDLDFGLYRIMHAKAAEVTQFLDRDLLPQVKQEFSQYKTADKAELEQQLAKAVEQAQALGADPETLPKVKELRAKIGTDAVDIATLEGEVYDHLISFFSRYYSDGDFLSKRRYSRDGRYAIPYDGEEVKLHWANHDQYYIKTSEYLRDYAFRLNPSNDANPMRVHFRLVDAAEGEHGNIKAANGKDRVFFLATGDFASLSDNELSLGFEYRPATLTDWPEEVRSGKTKPPAQKDLTDIAEKRILAVTKATLLPWIAELAKPHFKADGEKADYSRLRAHLNRYFARNTFDYFIHKDLGGFLRRELDFYIKNEVMQLDDVENETAPRVEQYLSKIKVVRRVAGKIITFLAQLEDFQKALWLKKKFVVDTQYCITLDRIPESLYSEIAANDLQRQEWVHLFAIDEIKANNNAGENRLFAENPSPYSIPLTIDFLKANSALPLDTRFFDSDFTSRLLEASNVNDSTIDGTLVHSDNFQGLRLLEARYRQQIKCIYIDPPYNTASSAIPYKNDYKHSSFATMLHDRLKGLSHLLRKDGAIFVSIDKTERTVLEHLLDDVFGVDNRIEELIWAMNTNNSQAPNYSTNHEYVLVYAKNRPTAEQDRNMFRDPKPGFEEVMELASRLNNDYPSIAAIEKAVRQLYEQHKIEFRDEIESQGLEWEDEKGNDPWKGLYNYSRAEYRNSDGQLVREEDAKALKARIWIWREDNISMPATKQAASTREPNHKNYRFYRPPHPKTGKPCPHPKSGWKFAYDDDEDSPDKRSFVALDRDSRIVWGQDETKLPQLKRMLHEVETNVGKSVFADYSDGEKQTSAMFGQSGLFLAPKHADFVSRFILHAAKSDSTILDCFGGSGSTAHAVIKLNRGDRGERKFVLIEVAEYFDRVLKPRVLKAIYSPDWRAGKPISRQGISQCIKIIRLESYEDALNNLEVKRSTTQHSLLEHTEAQGSGKLREQYMLRYMLKVETTNSPSLLNVAAFSDPTAYRLVVKRPGSDESREVCVDLIETFNWLLGLTVQHIAVPQQFSAQFERDVEKRLRVKGRVKSDKAGPFWFRTLTGTMPDGRKVLVIWRKLTGKPEEDNLVLDEWFTKQGYSSKDSEFGLIYVNGGNNLENLKTPDDTWKVRLIEDDFQRLMFATEGN